MYSYLRVGLLTLGLITAVRASASEGQVTSLLYSCNLTFQAGGKSIYLGVGFTDLKGTGTISCYDYGTGATQHIPVRITARGPGAGLGVTGLTLSGGATGIGLTSGPESLLGRYVAARANAAVGVGVGSAAAFRLTNNNATIEVSAQAQTGIGMGFDLLWLEIERDGSDTKTSSASEGVSKSAPAEVRVVYVKENQPVHIVDNEGRLVQVIYLRK